jgi:multisubunit Na+/H+ antiporter MnhB subunit
VARRAPLEEIPRGHDDAVRRTSAARVVAGVQLCVGWTTALVLLVSGAAIANAGGPVTGFGETFRTPGLVTLAVGLAVVGVAVGVASAVGVVTAVVRRRPERAA